MKPNITCDICDMCDNCPWRLEPVNDKTCTCTRKCEWLKEEEEQP